MSVEVHAAEELAYERAHAHGGTTPGVSEREENLAVATSSLAALATAWAAFQAATWSSKQTFLLAHAFRQRALSTEARLEGNQQVQVDADMFTAWATAYSEHNTALTQFLYDRFPPRLKVATDAWIATRPLVSNDAPAHPFAMLEYKVEVHDRAVALGKEADGSIKRGEDANLTADTYDLATVFLAMIIVLASLSTRLRFKTPRRTMLLLSTIGLVAAATWLALRPVAWLGH